MTNWCSVYGMVERVDWHIEECIGSWMLSSNHISAFSSLSWTIGGVHLVDPFLMMWHLETRRWMIDRTREERMDGCKSTSEHNLLSRRYDFCQQVFISGLGNPRKVIEVNKLHLLLIFQKHPSVSFHLHDTMTVHLLKPIRPCHTTPIHHTLAPHHHTGSLINLLGEMQVKWCHSKMSSSCDFNRVLSKGNDVCDTFSCLEINWLQSFFW